MIYIWNSKFDAYLQTVTVHVNTITMWYACTYVTVLVFMIYNANQTVVLCVTVH